MIDTHCHVHFNAYDDDRDAVLERTRSFGVRMITIGTQQGTSQAAVEMAEQHPDIWCSVGLHPSHTHRHTLHIDENETIVTREETFDTAFYRNLIQTSSRVVAIGEVGLDYWRLPADPQEAAQVKEAQLSTLHAAMSLADEQALPLILHVRDAHADMQALLAEQVGTGRLARRGVIHCFTGTIEEAQAYHALGFLTSITGIVTFPDKKNPDQLTPFQEVVKALPLEWLMIETDAPYLTPAPHRGQRNEPWMVQFVARELARLKQCTVEEVVEVTTKNAERLFQIPPMSKSTP